MLTTILGIGAYITLAYTLIVASFEMVWGVEAASVIADRYDYSYNIPNTTVYISIEALPRDVYKDTKALASILLTMGSLSLTIGAGTLVFICYPKKCSPWWPNELLTGLSSFFTSMLPFAYGAFVLWKFKTMTETEKSVWDDVDPRFMQVFSRMEPLLILNGLPFGVWTGVCIGLGVQYLRE